MSIPEQKKNHYDSTWEILKNATDEFQAQDIPLAETPPAVADWLIMSVLALGQKEGISELAAITIIQRQLNLLEAWRKGEPPFERSHDDGAH